MDGRERPVPVLAPGPFGLAGSARVTKRGPDRDAWAGWPATMPAACFHCAWRGVHARRGTDTVPATASPSQAWRPGVETQCKVTYESPASEVPRLSLVSQIGGGGLVGCSLSLGEERVHGFP